jgi:hypothetical protein
MMIIGVHVHGMVINVLHRVPFVGSSLTLGRGRIWLFLYKTLSMRIIYIENIRRIRRR